MALEQFKTQILLLHSEQSTLDKLSTGFADRYTVHCATSGSEALNTLGQTAIDVIVTAQQLPGMSGLDALREAKRRSPETVGILLAGNDGEGVEALVGANEVFQVVRGGVTPDSLRALIDDATRQARLMQLTESANDTTADVDASAEHIVMETSENGSSIITDVTGQVPALDPKKFEEANVGSRSVDVLVLTKDDEFLTTVRESARGMHTIVAASTLAQADEAVASQTVGVAVVDAAMVGDNVEKLTMHLRAKSPRLVSIVAGRRDDGEMLMDLINRGKVYRFLLKPVSPGRARLAIEASAKHHLEAPDAAFKAQGSASTTPAKAAKRAPAPAPTAKRSAAASKPKPAPKPAAPKPTTSDSQPIPKIVVEPRPVPESQTFDSDRLGDAFTGDDSSFTETMTGIFRTVGEKFSSATSRDTSDPIVESIVEPVVDPIVEPVVEPVVESSPQAMSDPMLASNDSDGPMYLNPKVLGIGGAALVVAIAFGWWLFSGSDDPVETARPSIAEQNPRLNSAPVIDADLSAEERTKLVNESLAVAESALLARNSADAAVALQRVVAADPDNARLPFLMAQLEQMQLREFLDSSRVAIREGRFEDAAVALNDARALGSNDTTEIELASDELNAALSSQRVEDVLTKANARLDSGDLTAPSNDNASYYYELALSNDPGNAAAEQGLSAVASKLVLQARTEIDAGRFGGAEQLLNDARRLDPRSAEVVSTAAALSAARSDAAQRQRDAEQRQAEQQAADARAAQQAEAERLAAAQTYAIEETPADNLTDDKTEIPADLPPPASSGQADNAGRVADVQSTTAEPPAPVEEPVQQRIQPVAASSLNRTKYVAPKYPRAAQRRGVSGWVEIEFVVDIDGSVTQASVVNSEPGLTFVNAAVKAVEGWKYEPIIENGVVVQKLAAVRMMFAVE
ncbi:MAG: TonB family protein [Woeseiaceae bacterium]